MTLVSQDIQVDTNRRAFLTGYWKKKPNVSNIDSRCLNNHGVYCLSCKDSCEEEAIVFSPLQRGIQLPMIISERCTHCKKCIESCPADAISISDIEEANL